MVSRRQCRYAIHILTTRAEATARLGGGARRPDCVRSKGWYHFSPVSAIVVTSAVNHRRIGRARAGRCARLGSGRWRGLRRPARRGCGCHRPTCAASPGRGSQQRHRLDGSRCRGDPPPHRSQSARSRRGGCDPNLSGCARARLAHVSITKFSLPPLQR